MVRLTDEEESKNIEDRRGDGGAMGRMDGGGPIPIPIGGRGGIGIFGLLIILGLMFFFGVDPRQIMPGGDQPFPMPQSDRNGQPLPKWDIPSLPGTEATNVPGGSAADIQASDEGKVFAAKILRSTERFWNEAFKSFGRTYPAPKMVLYSESTPTGCGTGQSAMGPFYCPLDQQVYLDLDFYNELSTRFGAPGDFAQAYVIAHEIGHHVQKVLGIADQVQAYKERVSEVDANALQVRMELQADCFAGVWAYNANQTRQILEPGDIEEGLNAAKAIGDDRLQRKAMGRVVPDAFTHGSSEQRIRWLKRGLDTGDIRQCDTFNTDQL